MKTIIKNGHVINPNGVSGMVDVLIENDKIADIGQGIDGAGVNIIDATGMVVMPGLFDMHTHLREPGFEYKEDIFSGTLAAAAGGFTSIACMPNTNPVTDNAPVVEYIINRAKAAGHAHVYPIGAITKGLKGEELAEMGLMMNSGAAAFSDDGMPVESAGMMKKAMRYAMNFNALLISHCEDFSLVDGGVMNDGKTATLLGLRGNTRAAEEVMIAREIILANTLGYKVHIAHVSTAFGVEMIRHAKSQGIAVSCETCPHYFTLDDSIAINFNTLARVNPPIREKSDVDAILRGIADGTIDCIVTDHAPHSADDKNVEFDLAANGISGLETALSLSWNTLVRGNLITQDDLVRMMSIRPAQLLNQNGGSIERDGIADVIVFDPNHSWQVTEHSLYSKGKNTPFIGRELTGKVMHTFTAGRHVIKDAKANQEDR